MFCQKCGKELDDDARFCEYCGAAVNRQLDNDGDDYGDVYTKPGSTGRKKNNYHRNTQNHRTGLIIGSIGGAAVLLILLAFLWCPEFNFLNKFLSQKETKQSTSETIALSQTATPIPEAASSAPITEETPTDVTISEEEGLIRANTEPRVKGKCFGIRIPDEEDDVLSFTEGEIFSELYNELVAVGYDECLLFDDSDFEADYYSSWLESGVKNFALSLIVVESLDIEIPCEDYLINDGVSIVTYDYLPFYLEELKNELEMSAENEDQKEKTAGVMLVAEGRTPHWRETVQADLWEAGYDHVEMKICQSEEEREEAVSELISQEACLLVVDSTGSGEIWENMAEEGGIKVVAYDELADYLKMMTE